MRRANIFSFLYFWWPVNILKHGASVSQEHVPAALSNLKSASTRQWLVDAWDAEVTVAAAAGRRPSLQRAFFKCFGGPMLLVTLFLLTKSGCQLLQTQMLARLLKYLANSEEAPERDGYLYAFGIVITGMAQSLLHQWSYYNAWILGLRMRISLVNILFDKSLRIDLGVLSKRTSGSLLNLVSTDVERLQGLPQFTPYLLVAPIESAVTLYLCWRQVGPSALAGVGVILACVPFMSFLSKKFGAFRLKMAKISDERIKLVSQVLSGIKVIKLLHWEPPYSRWINGVRAREMAVVRLTNTLKAFVEGLYFSSSQLIAAAVVITFVQTGGDLTAEIIFTTVSLFGLLQLSLGKLFPVGVQYTAEALISLTRFQSLLEESEIDKGTGEVPEPSTVAADSQAGTPLARVVVNNLCCKWASHESPTDAALAAMLTPFTQGNAVRNATFTLHHGEIAAVVGEVDAGKPVCLWPS